LHKSNLCVRAFDKCVRVCTCVCFFLDAHLSWPQTALENVELSKFFITVYGR